MLCSNKLTNFVGMKKSINYLPDRKKRDLRQLVDLINDEVKDCVMIILYGSYARNTYVDYDERCEFGVPTYFMSDYDILIVTKRRMGLKEHDIYTKIKKRFFEDKNRAFHTKPQFINESISNFNKSLELGRYFYTDIKKDAVVLYDTEEYKLARRRKLNYKEIDAMAEEYYDDKFGRATSFLIDAPSATNRADYKQASFYLHQSTENFLRTIPLVYILYVYKDHDLEELIDCCKLHTLELAKVFPRDTEEERRLFKLLQDAYVQARYNINFIVTKADIEALLSKVEMLREITERICRERLDYYKQMIEQETAKQSDASKTTGKIKTE